MTRGDEPGPPTPARTGAARPAGRGGDGAPRLLIVSNGHGEDAIGARLATGLARTLPRLEIEAFPLVGLGAAYRAAGVSVVGPRRELPSGGLTLHHLRMLLADLRAGLLGLTLAQLGFLLRAAPAAVLVVGDAYAQFMAQLVPAPRRVLQPLVSIHQAFDLDGGPLAATALHRTFMERIRAPERWLMARADKVYTRDAETAAHLRRCGLANVVSLGNPMVDDLEAEPLVEGSGAGGPGAGNPAGAPAATPPGAPAATPAGAPAGTPAGAAVEGAAGGDRAARLVVALLPGSRGYAERSLVVMAGAMLALAGGASGRGSAGGGQRGGHATVIPAGGAAPRLLGLVAWARPGVPAPPARWTAAPTPNVDGVEAAWRPVADPAIGASACQLWFVRGRFAAVLASASVVIGTAGTANEQAAARGLPVVSFAVPPDYGLAFLANQERLLGGAERVVASDPEAVAGAVLAAAEGSAHQRTAALMGPRRMGPAGATAAIVADLAGWLDDSLALG